MRILHVLSQRPSLTGSGVTLDAVVRCAAAAGHEQRVVVATPGGEPDPQVGGLPSDWIHPLHFGVPPLDFELPGMSDVMPYPSSRFSGLGAERLALYREAWIAHLRPLVAAFEPHLIQSHHVWLVSALLKDIAPEVPVATQCHATGFRQMALCPHLADGVRSGVARNDAFLVLQRDHARLLREHLGVDEARITIVGAGYRDEVFCARGRARDGAPALLYAGKLSASKGLPQLLDVFERLAARRPGLQLHVAGGGSGPEADEIRARMERMRPGVVPHGRLEHPALAELARRATVFVLPSFYEGLPLVLVEALACGCRAVATALPGIVGELKPRLGSALITVELPRMASVDRPSPEGLPAFLERLQAAIESALDAPPLLEPPVGLADFTWAAVFARIERVWRRLVPATG